MEKFKLTRGEKAWILYDVGNSAFILLVSTIIPIYFNALAAGEGISDSDYLAAWGYAGSVSTLLVAVSSPLLGTLADRRNMKPILFVASLILGALGCACLGFAWGWVSFLVIFVIAKVGYSSANVFYDAMLPEITTESRMDKVSSLGYAFGYIGSCIPFILSLVVVLFYERFGISQTTAMLIAFLITTVWWVGLTIPLLRTYRHTAYSETSGTKISETFRRFVRTFRNIRREKHIFIFLLSFFFFIDGVYTIIEMATAYGTAVGLDSTGLLLALLLTDRRLPVRDSLRPLRRQVQHGPAHQDLHPRLYGHRALRDLPAVPVAVLDAGRRGRHVPGRHPGAVSLLLREDHPRRKERRILRPVRHLRQGRVVPRHADRRRRQPDDRQREHRRRRDRRDLRHRLRHFLLRR